MILPRPRELQELLVKLNKNNATPMIVGGAVRDWVLGLEPKDLDIEVFGLNPQNLEAILSQFGKVDLVGKAFGVYKLRLNQTTYDFSLPRRDSKVGKGHKGFEVTQMPNLSPLEASLRRDFTINSIFYDPINEKLMDPHGGLEDIKRKVLRHTSQAFVEDPLRSLRAVQFSARFNMSLAPQTALICQEMYKNKEYHNLATERIREEFIKFLTKGKHHLQGFHTLRATSWMELLPEIKAIDGLHQDPQWHPEGDTLTHTAHCLSSLHTIEQFQELPDEEKLSYCLAVLCHDLGKPHTSFKEYREELKREVITSPNHPEKGLEPTKNLLEKLGFNQTLVKRSQLLTLYHMEHLWVKDLKGVRHLAAKLSPANPHSENPQILETIKGLSIVTEADHSGRPPLKKGQPEKMKRIIDLAIKDGCFDRPPKPLLRGKDLIERNISDGVTHGKTLGAILKKAYSNQLDGKFSTKELACKWLDKNLRKLVIENGGPTPFITGENLIKRGMKPGKDMGEILEKSYTLQLNGTFKDSKDAWDWATTTMSLIKNNNLNLDI